MPCRQTIGKLGCISIEKDIYLFGCLCVYIPRLLWISWLVFLKVECLSEGARFPGTAVTESYEMPCRC